MNNLRQILTDLDCQRISVNEAEQAINEIDSKRFSELEKSINDITETVNKLREVGKDD